MIKNIVESGRSMIEMLGVIAIMGVITIGAIELMRSGMDSQKRGQVDTDLIQIYQGVKEMSVGYNDYSNIDNRILDALKITKQNPFGGKYEVEQDPRNPRQFVIRITGLSTSICEVLRAKAYQDSIGYIKSGGTKGGATSIPDNCKASDGDNKIEIFYY
ncbi:MAG: hypothetical protein JJV93_01780 [Alphaproteobacteria bacterium]|nr:hypothetical protein [Alphaproteobacteria bacterium]MBL0717977.1 hypothetical protein [Alphaproteobacteria bacterium]